jgi:DNA-binding transcriptional ArsR family regulator
VGDAQAVELEDEDRVGTAFGAGNLVVLGGDPEHLADRLVIALEQALMRGTDRASYATEADVSPATASADFRRLVDAGMVDQAGRGRSVRYEPTESLRRQIAGQ